MRTLVLSLLVALVALLGCNDTASVSDAGDVAAPAAPPPGFHKLAKDGPEYLTPWGWSTVPFVPPAAAEQAPKPNYAPYALPSKHAKASAAPTAMLLASDAPATTPASWLEPEWDFDPVGGSDNNNCLTVSTPCKTFAAIASRWGTLEPTFPQNTFVRQLNAQTGTSDPVRIRVHTSGTAAFWYIGVPHVTTTGTLGTVTAKTYGTAGSGHPLEVTTTAGQVAGTLITDITQASSTGILDRNTTGNVWIVEQPLTAPVVPNTAFGGGRSENNAWTTGDSYTIATLPAVYMLEWTPTFGDFNSAFTNMPVLQDVQIVDNASDPGFSPMIVKNASVWQDVSIIRSIGMVVQNSQGFYCTGCDIYGQLSVDNAFGATSGLAVFEGGALRSSSASYGVGIDIGADFIIGSGGVNGGTLIQQGGRWGFTGTAVGDGIYIDTNGTWSAEGYDVLRGAGSALTQVYGPGTLNIAGSVSFATGTATTTMLMGAWTMNGGTTACAQSNVTPSVINCGITLTPAHYDAAFGVAGFGSNAKSWFTSANIQTYVNN